MYSLKCRDSLVVDAATIATLWCKTAPSSSQAWSFLCPTGNRDWELWDRNIVSVASLQLQVPDTIHVILKHLIFHGEFQSYTSYLTIGSISTIRRCKVDLRLSKVTHLVRSVNGGRFQGRLPLQLVPSFSQIYLFDYQN